MKYYLSHAIRGKAGPEASHNTQAKNCAEVIEIANQLRALFPSLDLYVPAENETFVQIAYDTGHLSEKQILDIDCRIIDNVDGVIVYVPDGEIQGGRLIEYNHAKATNKPVVIFHVLKEAVDWLTAKYRGELI